MACQPGLFNAGAHGIDVGEMIRADRHALGRTRLLLTLLEKRRSPADGGSMVDALILRLQTP